MAYQAIYRKWRPLVFEDIIGQSHVTQALKNQILTNRISHAYLFSGTRGTGKTTAAKVFSRAVNCLNNKNGSPCNECEVCKGILNGSIFDIVELDAASNNKVDDIRGLIEDVGYAATQAKYRVYIIDEVHMLTTSAFNALLKTLEEPPEYVIFILATTEAHKVPETILSRCQRFDFKRIRPSDIVVRMKEITHADGISISDEALRLIARLAEGSMRDGLSILERVVSASSGDISVSDAVSVLGIASADTEFSMAGHILAHDAKAILELVGDILSDGADLNVFITNLIKHFRDLLVCKITDKPFEVLDYSDDDLTRLSHQANKATYDEISNIISLLNKAVSDAKWVKTPRVIYELALIKAARPELDESRESLGARLSRAEEMISELEDKIREGITVTVAKEDAPEEKPAEKEAKKQVSGRLFVPIPPEKMNNANPIVIAAKKWDKISKALFRSVPYLAPVLLDRKIAVDGEGILLLFERSEATSKQIGTQHINGIKSRFKKLSGVDCNIKLVFRDEVEDAIVDIWTLPEPKEAAPEPVKDKDGASGIERGTDQDPKSDDAQEAPKSEDDIPEQENALEQESLQKSEAQTEIKTGEDPFERFLRRYPDLVERTDKSDFLDYSADSDSFVQSSLGASDEEDDEEEFLEPDEIDGENE